MHPLLVASSGRPSSAAVCTAGIMLAVASATFLPAPPRAAAAPPLPRFEVIPLPDAAVELSLDGIQRVGWHFDADSPRPYFFPFRSPSGGLLTRMGHPGAENHDHHRSIWFAHHDVDGHSFWQDESGCTIRQDFWLVQDDGDDEGVLAVQLTWLDPSGTPLLEQQLIASLREAGSDEHALEIQTTFRPAEGRDQVVLGKTNFGLLAVRVARSISEFFGGGTLTSSEGATGEPAIFGNRAAWVDYSGPVGVGQGNARQTQTEGITFFDHPANPHYPSRWHVRADGWMGASFCFDEAWPLTQDSPLTLRYLLYAHRGGAADAPIADVQAAFHARPGWTARPAGSGESHRQWVVERAEAP
jgi:hypothetical protein